MENQNLPLFYKKPVPLNMDAHAALTIAPSPDGYKFAASTQTVLLSNIEFFDASRQYPIIFAATGESRVVPLALLGLEQNENLFVDADGAWRGSYIPAYVRRYPFITTDGAEGQIAVCFDEEFDGFLQEGGTALFSEGKPTEKLTEIQAFLQDFLLRMGQAEQFGAMLVNAGLLRQIDAQANLKDGRTFALNGMLVVDEQKLAQLPDIDIVKLFRNGMLAQIHAHLLSLRNLEVLLDYKARQVTPSPENREE